MWSKSNAYQYIMQIYASEFPEMIAALITYNYIMLESTACQELQI